MVNSAMLDVGFQGHRKVSNIGRAELYQSLNIGGAANPFHYCDSEILVGLQPLSPTYSYGPAMGTMGAVE